MITHTIPRIGDGCTIKIAIFGSLLLFWKLLSSGVNQTFSG